MRWSNAFIPTLRDDPADAEATSHKLLVRGGFMRQLMSGSYSVLPLGVRVCRKITAIVRDEMEKIGGQEFALPALHPAEVWQQSGRWDLIGDELFRLRDRKNHAARGRAAVVPPAPPDLVPVPDEVPRRAAPQVRPAARA
jgi:prolyl-tRNA synthetase